MVEMLNRAEGTSRRVRAVRALRTRGNVRATAPHEKGMRAVTRDASDGDEPLLREDDARLSVSPFISLSVFLNYLLFLSFYVSRLIATSID